MTRKNQWIFLLAVLCCSIQTKAQDFYNQGIGYNIIGRADKAVEVVGMRGGEYAERLLFVNLCI